MCIYGPYSIYYNKNVITKIAESQNRTPGKLYIAALRMAGGRGSTLSQLELYYFASTFSIAD